MIRISGLMPKFSFAALFIRLFGQGHNRALIVAFATGCEVPPRRDLKANNHFLLAPKNRKKDYAETLFGMD